MEKKDRIIYILKGVNDDLIDKNFKLKNENNALKKMNKELNDEIEKLENENNSLINENKKLKERGKNES